MGVSDTTEKDWEEHYKECSIPESLLNTLADINVYEIHSHISSDEKLYSWLCSWHEKIKQELYDFANKSSRRMRREDDLYEKISKLDDKIKLLQSDNQSLKNMIVQMCYEKYGE